MALLENRPAFQPSANGQAGADARLFAQRGAQLAALLSQLGFSFGEGVGQKCDLTFVVANYTWIFGSAIVTFCAFL
jgi:hypothetical protein